MTHNFHLCFICNQPMKHDTYFNHNFARLTHYRCSRIIRKQKTILRGAKYLSDNEISSVRSIIQLSSNNLLSRPKSGQHDQN